MAEKLRETCFDYRRLGDFSDLQNSPGLLLHNRYRGYFPGLKRPGNVAGHLYPSSVQNDFMFCTSNLFYFT